MIIDIIILDIAFVIIISDIANLTFVAKPQPSLMALELIHGD